MTRGGAPHLLPPAHCPKLGMPVEQGWVSLVLMMKRRVGLALLSITASWFKELVLSLLNHLKAIAGQIWVDSHHVCIAGKRLGQSSGFLSSHSACYYSPMHLQGAQMQSRGPCTRVIWRLRLCLLGSMISHSMHCVVRFLLMCTRGSACILALGLSKVCKTKCDKILAHGARCGQCLALRAHSSLSLGEAKLNTGQHTGDAHESKDTTSKRHGP